MSHDSKSDEPKTERFNMFMSPSEMKAIDEWAWENRIRSKSEAVRRLVQIGIYSAEAVDQIADLSSYLLRGDTEMFEDLNKAGAQGDLARQVEIVGKWVKDSTPNRHAVVMEMIGLNRCIQHLREGDSIEEAAAKADEARETYRSSISKLNDVFQRYSDEEGKS